MEKDINEEEKIKKKNDKSKKEKIDKKEEVDKGDDYIEVKEEKIEDKPNIKHKNNSIVYIIIIIFLGLIIIAGGSYILVSSGKLDFISKLNNKSNIELRHTSAKTVKSNGVYITDVSDVVDEVMPSIVSITSKTVINSGRFGPSFYGYDSGSYTAEGAGSGVIVYEDDDELFVLTNYHVVENSTELSVKFIDDKSYDATVKGVSERKDIAIVSVNKKDITSETLKQIKIATLGNSDELKVGNGIIAIGNALGYGQSVTTGVVSAVNREVSTDEYVQDMIQIDAAINGGNSGGALLNSKGEVVGINSLKYSSSGISSEASIEGMGFAIPISDVEDIIKELIDGKNDEGGLSLGIAGYMTDSGEISNYNLPEGFYVSEITSGGNADNSELEIGNIITEIDNTKVTSVETIRKVLNKKEKGDKVILKVKYANKNQYDEKNITVKLN